MMAAAKTRALIEDALFQVLDNSVFRILAIVVLLPILVCFVVAIRPEELSVLFGTWSWSWSELGLNGPEPHLEVINTVVAILLDGIGGVFGVLFCITATAFFVPRMIEKGAADLLFHKPVSRAAFYFSRYLSGLFFVAILSSILVVGVFAGLAIVSGHVDTGILWSTVTLIYVFTLVYSLCMLVGVVTRSTVAAILLTVLFWFVNSCIHTAWGGMELTEDLKGAILEAENIAENEEEDAEAADVDDRHAFVRYLHKGLHVAHLVLPKTSDADVLAQKLRKAVSPPAYQEPGVAFRIKSVPSDWEQLEPESVAPGHPALPDLCGDVVFACKNDADHFAIVRRRPLKTTTRTLASGRELVRKEKLDAAFAELSEALVDDERLDDWLSYPGFGGDENAMLPSLEALNARLAVLREGQAIEIGILRRDSWLYSFELRRPEEASADDLHEFVDAIDLQPVQANWYNERFVAGAPLAYNPTYSVVSSLLFAFVMLSLGAWRLSRIDF